MKNKEITIYDLIGLIKDGKAPKRIKYEGVKYRLNSGIYENEVTGNVLGYDFKIELCLGMKVEILPEENDEWEDIKELEKDDYGFTTLDLKKIVNQLIKNQKYLKERLDKNEDKIKK